MSEIKKTCPKCNGTHVVRHGKRIMKDGSHKQVYRCMSCGRMFF